MVWWRSRDLACGFRGMTKPRTGPVEKLYAQALVSELDYFAYFIMHIESKKKDSMKVIKKKELNGR